MKSLSACSADKHSSEKWPEETMEIWGQGRLFMDKHRMREKALASANRLLFQETEKNRDYFFLGL